MKISLLSGAYKNAGDYLIVNRTIGLLKHVNPDCDITVFQRNEALDNKLNEINQTDALVFAGGPAYSKNVFPKRIPICKSLDDICIPVYTIGVGWHGHISSNRLVYSGYKFSQDTKEYISWLGKDASLSCRDWYSVKVLKNNGFKNTIMTGCPAWYDIKNIRHCTLKNDIQIPFKKICISDCGNPANLNQSFEIVKYIRDKYPKSSIVYVFHRGINADKHTDESTALHYKSFTKRLTELGVNYKDISYSSDGFKIYDDCDLHIGMRVHAHIYNLSIRNVSILIEEDGRGTGVDEALGLFSIKAYDEDLLNFYKPRRSRIDRLVWKYIVKEYLFYRENPYLIQQIDDYLYILKQSDYLLMSQAYEKMRGYYNQMIKQINTIFKR